MTIRPDNELVKLQLDGPDAGGLIVLDEDSSLEQMKQILEAKIAEIRTLNQENHKAEISAIEMAETLKLANWVNEREAKLAILKGQEKEKALEREDRKNRDSIEKKEKELAKIASEEKEKKRITIYENGKEFVTSVTEASSREQMEYVKSYLGKKADSKDLQALESLLKKSSKAKSHEDSETIQVNQEFELSKDSNPDLLKLALSEHKDKLEEQQVAKIEAWMKENPATAADKVRIFHAGKEHPHQSSEVSLSLHGKEFLEEINLQLAASAYMLPEHRKKLDRYYSDLSQGKTAEPDILELPSNLPGRFSYLTRDCDKEVLQVALDTRQQILQEKTQEKLRNWIEAAPQAEKLKNEIRIYDVNEPSRYKTVSRAMSPEEIEAEISELGASVAYVRKEDAEHLRDWLSKTDSKKRSKNERENMDREPDTAKEATAKSLTERTEHLGRLQALLHDMASHQGQTVDGYYSEQWGADKSALAAGPMGAASGGLRPMGIWQFTEVLQSALRDNLYRQQLADLNQAGKVAVKLKAEFQEEKRKIPAPFRELGGGSGLESKQERQIHAMAKEKLDLAISQIYSSIQHLKSKEHDRRPNRDNKELDEFIPPGPGAGRGPGGFGGFSY